MTRAQGESGAEPQAQRGREWEQRLETQREAGAPGYVAMWGKGLLPLTTGSHMTPFGNSEEQRGECRAVSSLMTALAGHPLGISRGCQLVHFSSTLPGTPWHWCQALLKWQRLDIAEVGGASRWVTW